MGHANRHVTSAMFVFQLTHIKTWYLIRVCQLFILICIYTYTLPPCAASFSVFHLGDSGVRSELPTGPGAADPHAAGRVLLHLGLADGALRGSDVGGQHSRQRSRQQQLVLDTMVRSTHPPGTETPSNLNVLMLPGGNDAARFKLHPEHILSWKNVCLL